MLIKPVTLTKDQEVFLSDLHFLATSEEFLEEVGKVMSKYNLSLHQVFPELPEQAFETIYQVAKQFYEGGNYHAALPLFRALVAYDHHSYRFCIGCAACLHILGHYLVAAQGYILAYAADPINPIPLFYAAECCEKLGQPDQAIIILALASAISGKRKEYQGLKEKADLIGERLKKQMSKKKS